MPTKEKINCYNDPNWIDEALKRCSHFGEMRGWFCGMCCNYSICNKFKQEAREKQIAEMREQLLNLQELKIQMCESESNLNGLVAEFDSIPVHSISYSPRELYWYDSAVESPVVSYDIPMNSGTWRVVTSDNDTTTFQYVGSTYP